MTLWASGVRGFVDGRELDLVQMTDAELLAFVREESTRLEAVCVRHGYEAPISPARSGPVVIDFVAAALKHGRHRRHYTDDEE